jgi:hypothetical protein
MQAHDRIHRQGIDPRPLSHHLAVNLTLGGDIDHDVIENEGGTTQAVALPQRPFGVIVGLGGRQR